MQSYALSGTAAEAPDKEPFGHQMQMPTTMLVQRPPYTSCYSYGMNTNPNVKIVCDSADTETQLNAKYTTGK
ncbi:unnamed protein product [Gongylonema pulchrum]|uniref:DUF4150 domain-containing protein n=1 Tax=Gongylonema pulchrum TaxID=637853 RepID=A0A183F0X6_9BILA|nr:unnamed protein product [Gongylonema pulchrum]